MFSSDIAAAAKIYQRQWQLIEVNFWLRRPLVVKIQLKKLLGQQSSASRKDCVMDSKAYCEVSSGKAFWACVWVWASRKYSDRQDGETTMLLGLLQSPSHTRWALFVLCLSWLSFQKLGQEWVEMQSNRAFLFPVCSWHMNDIGCLFCHDNHSLWWRAVVFALSALIGGDRGVIWWEKVVVQASTTP